jgi:hypothetical protein
MNEKEIGVLAKSFRDERWDVFARAIELLGEGASNAAIFVQSLAKAVHPHIVSDETQLDNSNDHFTLMRGTKIKNLASLAREDGMVYFKRIDNEVSIG